MIILAPTFYYVNVNISLKVKKTKALSASKYHLKFSTQRNLKNVSPELMVKSLWITTALAIILTIPSLGLFIGITTMGGGLALGALVGFGLHFLLLGFANKISEMLSALLG